LLHSDRITTVEVEQKAGNKDLLLFIHRYNAGHREASKLVKIAHEGTRDWVTAEAARLKGQIVQESRQASARLKKHVTSVGQQSSARISRQIKQNETEKNERARSEKLLSSLRFPGMNQRRNDSPDAYPDTFKWIFSDDAGDETATSSTGASASRSFSDTHTTPDFHWDRFTDWLRSNERLYWISGKPGSGKTTLVKYVVSSTVTKELLADWRPDCIVISHFFWHPGSQMQQSVKGLLCNLLFQLLINNPVAQRLIMNEGHDMDYIESHDWSVRQLVEALDLVMSQYESPIMVFIDGLDEVSTADGVLLLFRALDRLKSHHHVKLCFSSRPEPIISKRLSKYPHLRMQDLTMPDLQVYAQSVLEPPLREQTKFSRLDVSCLLRRIVVNAEGVFLWLCLAIQRALVGVELEEDFDQMAARIDRLPRDLNDLYEDMLERARDNIQLHRHSAKKIFRLVIVAQRLDFIPSKTLTLFGMMLALQESTKIPEQSESGGHEQMLGDIMLGECEKTEKAILSQCAGLLILRKDPGHIRKSRHVAYTSLIPYINSHVCFVHRTAYDFLLETIEGQSIVKYDEAPALELRAYIINSYLTSIKIFMYSDALNSLLVIGTRPPSSTLGLIDSAIPYETLPAASAPGNGLRLHLTEHYRSICVDFWRERGNTNEMYLQCSEIDFYEQCFRGDLWDYVVVAVSTKYVRQSDLDRLFILSLRTSLSVFGDGDGASLLIDTLYRLYSQRGLAMDRKQLVPTFFMKNAWKKPHWLVWQSPISTAINLMLDAGHCLISDDGYGERAHESVVQACKCVEAMAQHGTSLEQLSCYAIRSSKQKTKTEYGLELTSIVLLGQPLKCSNYSRRYLVLVTLSAFTVVKAVLANLLAKFPEYRTQPDVAALFTRVSATSNMVSKPKEEIIGAAVFESQDRITSDYLVQGGKREVVPHRSLGLEGDCMHAIHSILEHMGTEASLNTSCALWELLRRLFKVAEPGHGSLYSWLCECGVIREKMDVVDWPVSNLR
jgi:hypothetical protein